MSLADFRPGDRVICVSNIGVETYLDVGREYEIRAVTEKGDTFTLLSGGSFGRNRFARFLPMTERYPIDYKKRYREAREDLDAIHVALSDPSLDGPWGLVGRINKLWKRLCDLRDENQRMKRQLELVESYNFDRKGLTDDEALFDLSNYALKGLGKKPLSRVEWLSQRIGKALKKAFDKAERWSPENFKVHYSYSMPLQYIPLSFIITDEKHSHQADAYSPTGCGEGCLHPDCKDRK